MVPAIENPQSQVLFDVWGAAYGAGDGSTTFGVRDDRGRVKAGQDDMGGANAANRLTTGGSGIDGATLGAAGGVETHTLTTGEIPSHSHSIPRYIQGSDGLLNGTTGPHDNSDGNASNITTASTGGGGAHQNTQPTIVSNFIVKT